MVCVIGDIAGRYKTLMALIDKMPEGEVVSVGDMVDRGPRSKEVVEYFMNNGRAILGNHEHMMIDHLRNEGRDNAYYGDGVWFWNGGMATMESYGHSIPNNIVSWLETLPLYLEIEGHLVSHSFVPRGMTLEEACDLGDIVSDYNIIWSREEPERIEGYKSHIAGHNSQFGLRTWSDDQGDYAHCLDASREKVLTGIHLPSMKIYQQPYID